MFSFFRKSKKEPENNGRDKKGKGVSGKDSPTSLHVPMDLGKNKPAQKPVCAQSGNINVMPDVLSESGLRENGNVTASAVSDEVTAKIEKKVPVSGGQNDSNPPKPPGDEVSLNNAMEVSQNSKHSPSPVTSYATIAKTEAQQRRNSVKPCGHGTLAIAPKIPVPIKRDSSSTPPSSPDMDKTPRPNYRRVNSHDLPNIKENDKLKNRKSSLVEDPLNDTVRATIKLKVDLPQPPQKPKDIPLTNGVANDSKTKNLINQEAKFQSQLNDLSKQLSTRDAEANKLRFQMEELQRDVFAKSAGMDRLQAELQSATKESDQIRQRMRHLEEDLASSKQKNSELAEEMSQKTERFNTFQSNTNAKITELQSTIRGLRAKIESLEIQIDVLEKEKVTLEKQKQVLIQQRDDEKKSLDAALEKALQEKTTMQKKWEDDFEKLRTVNIIKEQELLTDFEWKLREIEQTCKKRLQDKDRKIEEQLQDAYRDADKRIKSAEKIMSEVEHLKSYEIEVNALRSLTVDQQKKLESVKRQLDEMKNIEQSLKNETKRLRNLVDLEKENLQHMQRIHNRDMVDRERKLKEAIEEQKTKIAFYWEDKLLQECRRLRAELEQLHYEERNKEIKNLRNDKDHEIDNIKLKYEKKVQEHLKEIATLKNSLKEKDESHQRQLEVTQTNTDRDILELRRLMDKIDMSHHDKFEKLVQEHEEELDKLNKEHEKQLKEVEINWQMQISSMRTTVELVKEQMEQESQQKMQMLIEQHRSELDTQWENLIHQKSEAIRLVEEEYVTKYKTLEEQFYTQQKSHEAREVELLKTIDTLKNEIASKDSTIGDLQNNVDTLEGGIQVLNQEMAFHGETVDKTKRDADQKIRGLQETIKKLQELQQKEFDEQQMKFNQIHKQSQATIEHLQRKCQCLTKLFEEVRSRYERRESRQEDLNIMSDLRQVIAEQEKDLACLNEEKRYFQMKLMQLQRFLEQHGVTEEDIAAGIRSPSASPEEEPQQCESPNQLSIPPTIPECEDDFEDAIAD